MSETPSIQSVMVTGATGFVGRYVLRELLARGYRPVCLVRSPDKLVRQHADVDVDRLTWVVGDITDCDALREAADVSQAAVHLVGIILPRRLRGQTFYRVHVRGTRCVVDALKQAHVKRYVHMSALGARSDATSDYHGTKWAAEQYVRDSGLDWTVFRPSLIHGHDGEFMRLAKAFVCNRMPPMIPYLGSGTAKVQPVSVKDVAHCFAESIARPDTIGQTYSLCGPRAYSWIKLFNACRALMPCARHWKPLVSLPVPAAKVVAALSAPPMALSEMVFSSLGMYRFGVDQVDMAQEDNVCDPAEAEETFGIRMRDFEDELMAYADMIP